MKWVYALSLFCLFSYLDAAEDGSGNQKYCIKLVDWCIPDNFVTCTLCEAVMKALDESIVDTSNEQVKIHPCYFCF